MSLGTAGRWVCPNFQEDGMIVALAGGVGRVFLRLCHGSAFTDGQGIVHIGDAARSAQASGGGVVITHSNDTSLYFADLGFTGHGRHELANSGAADWHLLQTQQRSLDKTDR